MNYYLDVLKKYTVFAGRATRKEYWMFALFNIIIGVVLTLVGRIIGFNFLMSIYTLAILLPGLAVTSRRLHDTGRSAWWILIGLIPFIGAFVLLIFATLDSQPGQNQYGTNPKGATVASKGINPFIIVAICLFAIVLIMAAISLWGYMHILQNSQASNTTQLPIDTSVSTNGSSDTAAQNSSQLPSSSNSVVGSNSPVPVANKTSSTNQSGKFYSSVGSFHVDFQGQPTQSNETTDTAGGPYTAYSFEKQINPQLILIMEYVDFPAKINISSNPNGALTASMNSAAQNSGGTIVSSQLGSYEGYPSNDYLVYVSKQNAYVKTRTILNSQKMYMLEVTYPKDQNSDKNSVVADTFFNSLTITQ